MNKTNKNNKFTVIGIVLTTLVLAGIAIFTAYKLYQTRNIAPTKPRAAQGTDVEFTCTQAHADQKPKCLNLNANWNDGACVLNICPNGDTTGEGACSANDNGAVVTHGNCFTDVLPKVRSLTTSTCFQMDTIVSNIDGSWCDLTQSAGSICTGYASNLGTCGGCSERYYCRVEGSVGKTLSKYDPSSDLECNKANPTSCEQNLAAYLSGQTTGKCYKTEAEAKNDPTCKGGNATNYCSLSFDLTVQPTATATAKATTTATATAKATTTATATAVPQCSSTCSSSADCTSGLTCYKESGASTGMCRNSSCTSETNCVCATTTPTATATTTSVATVTATATSNPQCNYSCTSNSNCPSSMICYISSGSTTGMCRNTQCLSETDCICNIANDQPTPTQTTTPTLPVVGTSWPTVVATGFGILVILGSLLLAL